MRRCYAGIGSRETPMEVQIQMESIAKMLALRGFVLRSGGANGADLAFERGCNLSCGEKEIYLPWRGFNDSESKLFGVGKYAVDLAREFHPRFDSLSQGAKMLIARNGYQVLGPNVDEEEKSEFIVCWTKDGRASGGTGQAIRIAASYEIPVFNLHDRRAEFKMWEYLST